MKSPVQTLTSDAIRILVETLGLQGAEATPAPLSGDELAIIQRVLCVAKYRIRKSEAARIENDFCFCQTFKALAEADLFLHHLAEEYQKN